MSRSTARWLVPPAQPAAGTAMPALPPFLPPPGLRPRTHTHEPAPDTTPWSMALVRGACAGLLVIVTALVMWSVLPTLLGWHAQVVLTGSMRPRIQPGDLVLAAPIRPGDLQTGRIVLFHDPAHADRTLVHRLVRFDGSGDMITKGDANRNEDSTPAATTAAIGIPRLRVPYVGRPVVWLHEHDTPKLLVCTTLLTGLTAVAMWPASGAAENPERPPGRDVTRLDPFERPPRSPERSSSEATSNRNM